MTRAQRLPSYGLFAAMLAAAGLPIYIHAPKFYVDQYGLSLTALASVLFVLRLVDVVQDPLLGWLSEKTRSVRGAMVSFAVIILGLSMWGLFAVVPPISALWWFALTLGGLFSSFSFLTICFYAQGVAKADAMGAGHVRLATWRETGGLLGVCVAAITPTVLVGFMGRPFVGFALGFAVLCLAGWSSMRKEWSGGRAENEAATPAGFAVVLKDPIARRLLTVALVNATPAAVSSTLFLFFVESRLDALGWEGPLLLLFFLSAAISAPLWGFMAQRFSPKTTLLAGMVLAVVTFAGALLLGSGDVALFAVVCIASGAALGADMTLLPALFARRLSKIAPNAGQAFGVWSFVTKFTLAFAAVALLPLLEQSEFVAGQIAPPDQALWVLSYLYAGVPCVLKLVAIFLLWLTNLTEDDAK